LEEQLLRPLKMLEFFGQTAGCSLQKLSQETIVLGNRKTPADETLTQPAMEQVYLAAGKTYIRINDSKPY